MSTQKTMPTPLARVTAANSPGGVAPHVRVQVQDSRQEWRLHSSFSNTAQAHDCADQLDQRGVPTRVVESRCCPTAG